MSTEAEAVVSPPAPVDLEAERRKKKNPHRLHRIFRQPKTQVALRPWRPSGKSTTTTATEKKSEDDKGDNKTGDGHALQTDYNEKGISAIFLQQIASTLKDEEEHAALLAQKVIPPTEEAKAKRAERFGVIPTATTTTAGEAPVLSDAMKARAERFGVEPAQLAAAATAGTKKGGVATSEANAAALRKRTERFMTEEEKKMSDEMAKRKARFAATD